MNAKDFLNQKLNECLESNQYWLKRENELENDPERSCSELEDVESYRAQNNQNIRYLRQLLKELG